MMPRFDRPVLPLPVLSVVAAAVVMLSPVSIIPVRAQAAAQAALGAPPPLRAPEATAAPLAATAPTVVNAPSDDRSMAARALDKAKQVARSAGDIFNRVPCLPPKGGKRSTGSLPHVAAKLAAGLPVVIVAFGSSSTQGHGSSSPDFSYPSRLWAQLHRQYPGADITVHNKGKGGEDAPEMMKRLKAAVIDLHPDLVIWQVGTNAVLRDLDPAETVKLVDEGISQIQAAGSDVVLVDPQYAPAVNARSESAGKMINMLGRVAELRRVGIFPRFEVMRDWHERQAIPIDVFVTPDGLHMNDWGYACFAQLLGDDIIQSVGQIKAGIAVPATVLTYRPM